MYRFSPVLLYRNALKSNIDAFDHFVNWFRMKEDEENEQIRRLKNFDLLNPELEVIRKTIEIFFRNLHNADYSKLRIERYYQGQVDLRNSQLMVTKNGLDFEVAQLSDGEKVLMLMVCDIARRLAIANEHANDTSLNDGIVLIDEIELHLHPRWQRQIISALRNTSPNIQCQDTKQNGPSRPVFTFYPSRYPSLAMARCDTLWVDGMRVVHLWATTTLPCACGGTGHSAGRRYVSGHLSSRRSPTIITSGTGHSR